MIAWALGRIGGKKAKDALGRFLAGSDGDVREEIRAALGNVQEATRTA
jgi:HEAT repeat protein